MKPLVDQDARDKIRGGEHGEWLDKTLIVEAAAGTGKTTELVQRVMALLGSGKSTLARLVAVTFTEKAAGEMKLRLRSEIEKARTDPATPPEERVHFENALAELEAAHIGTIHGFCSDLLRERPVEAKVDPLFEVAAEEEKERLLEDSFEPWFQAELAKPREGVRRLLRRRSRERDSTGPRYALRNAGAALIEQRDFAAKWRRDPFDRTTAIDRVLTQLDELGHMAARADVKDDWFTNSLVEIARFMEELHRREAVRQQRDYDGLEAELRDLEKKKLWGWKGRNRPFSREIDRTTALNRRDSAKKELGEVLDRCDADLAAALFGELRPLIDSYERLKTRAGKLDFLDLLVLTRDLLRSDKAVRNELQERFTHLLVDEFQDTDPLQAEILLLLAADNPSENDYTRAVPIPGKLFAVGDPKQSIYRFRRADVALYEMTKKRLKDRGAEVVHLTTSFRSAPSIQEAVNQAFAPLMQGNEDGSQAEYVALQPFREEPLLESGQPQPTLVVLPVPRPYSKWGKIANWVIDESYPDAVGAFVDWLVNKSGWKTSERGGGPLVPIEPRHICLLFKRFQNYGKDVTRSYVRALEARRVPHVLIGGRSYHAREEVLALRNAIAAIEWPEDELSMFATLRGPFFALGDDQLLAYRRAVGGSLHPFKKVDPAAITDLTRPVTEALSILGELHRRRNRRPIADTIVRLLEATRAHAGIAIWPTGEQALANVFRILDLARRFESQGATSFRSFVLRLQEDAERGGAAEAPVVEEGTEGVRMMTVHRAKGLEFPVVVLVDPTANAVMREPSRYVDSRIGLWAMPLAGCSPIELVEKREQVLRHDREEAHRLMYVAATRARDLLVVPAVGDEAIPGWVDVLHPVTYPAQERRREGERAPGCPQFTGDSVKERPGETVRGTSDSVAPGHHRPRVGSHRVVWWDPNVLDLDKEHDVGLRQQRILAADDGGAATQGERLHAAWQATRAEVRDAGAKPSLVIQTVTESKDGVALAPALASIPHETTGAVRTGRPRGKRFGVLVHAILAAAPLDASPEKLAEVARAQGRHIGAAVEEIEAGIVAASAALAHPLFARARAAAATPDGCRREAPVMLTLEDGSLIEGVLDLAFRETDAEGPVWTVVDFKTDVELGGPRRAAYETQLSLYARAIEAATGERARTVLLSV